MPFDFNRLRKVAEEANAKKQYCRSQELECEFRTVHVGQYGGGGFQEELRLIVRW
jgi:hypothetical protein